MSSGQLTARQIWQATPHFRDLRALEKAGVQPGKLGGMYQLLSMQFDVLFRRRLESVKFWDIKGAIDDACMKCRDDYVSLVTIADERYYGDFCGLATKTSYREPGYSEEVLEISCFYTDDDKFTDDKIPSASRLQEFEKILRGKGVAYKDDKIYCMKSLTEECIGQYKGRFYEYVFYLPSKYILSYA